MAEEKEDAVEGEDGEAEEQPKKKNVGLIVTIVIGLAIMIVTPLITYVVVKATVPPPLAAETVKEVEQATIYNLSTMFVNVAETKGTRVLKFEPHLVLSEARLGEDLKQYEAMLRDRVSLAAMTMTIDDLSGPQGRDTLKREIMKLINTEMKEKMSGAIIDVYFNDFLIQ